MLGVYRALWEATGSRDRTYHEKWLRAFEAGTRQRMPALG
jgi:hypothetical protein